MILKANKKVKGKIRDQRIKTREQLKSGKQASLPIPADMLVWTFNP